jgi:phosphatidylglycerol---prolipoprotein diacylglyceryl transferase
VPRAKNNRKSNRRGTTAARAAQSRARRDGEQAPRADAPGGSAARRPDRAGGRAGSAPTPGPPAGTPGAGTAPPAVTEASAVPAGLKRAKAASSRSAEGSHPDLGAGQSDYSKLVPAKAGPVGPAPVRIRGKADAEGTVPAPAGAGPEPGAGPDDASDAMPAWAAKAVEELLTVTYWLDPGEHGDPFGATIRFTGRRLGVTGRPQPGDTFAQEETVEGIVPGSGPVAITAEVRGIASGEWSVTARSVARATSSPFRPYPPPGQDGAARRAPLPRRVPIPAEPTTTVRTTSLLFTKVPGIVRYAYASLVFLGVLVGLAVQALLLTGRHYAVLEPLLISAGAVAAGIVGGKAWYIAVQRGRKFDGWCVQGFVTGAAIVVAAAALAGPGVPPGVYLATTGPALLIGMAFGRPGCFWAGCCVGRPTASRRGIWSSDRRVGCRREPAQLLEALASLVIGVAVLAVVLLDGLARSGPVAVAGLAAYTLVRQFILSLRAEPPDRWRYGRQLTIAVAAAALIASVVLLAR